MSPEKGQLANNLGATVQAEPKKIQRLPKGYKVSKRSLLRPPIPSPYAGKSEPKVVYLSTRMPFMSAFKRVKQLLAQAEKRETQSVLKKQKRNKKNRRQNKGIPFAPVVNRPPEPVTIKASGKAIDKALGLALFFQNQQEYRVTIKTGTAVSVDDVVPDEKALEEAEEKEDLEVDEQAMVEKAPEKEADEDEIPETRLRNTSVIEILVELKS